MSQTTDQLLDAIADFIIEKGLDTPEKMQAALNSPIGSELKNDLLNNVILSIIKEEQLEHAMRVHLEQMQLKELKARGEEETIDEPQIIEEINRDFDRPQYKESTDEKGKLAEDLKAAEDFAHLKNIINQNSEAFSNFERSAKQSLYNSVDDVLGKDGLDLNLDSLNAEDKQELEEMKQKILDAPSSSEVMKVLENNNIKPPAEEFLPKRGLLDEIRMFGAAKLAAEKTGSNKSIKEIVGAVEKQSSIKQIGERYEMVAEAAESGLSEAIGTILNVGAQALSQDTPGKQGDKRSYLQEIVDFQSADDLRAAAANIPSPPPPPPCGAPYSASHLSSSSYNPDNKPSPTSNSPDFKALKAARTEMKSSQSQRPKEIENEPEHDNGPRGPSGP